MPKLTKTAWKNQRVALLEWLLELTADYTGIIHTSECRCAICKVLLDLAENDDNEPD